MEVGDSTTAATFSIGGTAVTATPATLNQALTYSTAGSRLFAGTIIVTGSTAFKPSGVTTAAFVVSSIYGAIPASSGTAGGLNGVTGSVGTGGTVTLRTYDNTGTASTQAGTVSYVVLGT